MKTAKKIFSLLLVAVLMLSAIPFQASADTEYQYVINFKSGDYSADHNVFLTDMTLTVSQIPTPEAAPAGQKFIRWAYGSVNGAEFTMPANGVKTFVDTDFQIYSNYKFINVYAVYDHVHNFVDHAPSGSQNPTCTVGGFKTQKCTDTSCNETKVITLDALSHDFTAEVINVAATCETKGSKTIKCSRCDATNGTVEIPALGHNWGAWSVIAEPTLSTAGQQSRTCARCQKVETESTEKAKQAITFMYKEAQGGGTAFVANFARNEVKLVDNGKFVPEYKFTGWYDEANHKLGDSTHGWDCDHTVFYAKYVEDPNNDNMSQITVKARIYKNGVDQKYDRVLLPAEYVVDGTRILDYLDSKESEIITAIEYINPDYKWDGYYYNDDLKTTLTGQEKVNGAKTILIKVDVNPSNLVRVIVYRHDKVSTAAVPAYPVDGFTANETVLISDVQKAIKDATGRTYSISTMYTDSEWTQLLGGQKITGDTRKIVPDVDTFVLHVVSTSYSGSSTSSKPASNPATGDMIGMSMFVMVSAAAAAAFLLLNKKRIMK